MTRFDDFNFARRFRAINRTVQILLCLSLIIALNYLAAKYFRRVDLTESGTYTLAAETKAYIRALDKEVNIIVTIPDDPEVEELKQINKDLKNLLRQYQAEDARNGTAYLNIEFVDIYRQRKRAQEIANRYNLTQENVILVSCEGRTREIRQAELYQVENDEITGFRGERAFTSAILEVASNKQDKIYFLVGHGEMQLDDVDPAMGLSSLQDFLKERNFQVGILDLALFPAVPEDASMIVVAAPQAALLPEEVEKMRRYMSERNGRALVFLSPGRRHGLNDLFYDWGVLTDDMVVVDRGADFKAQGGDLIIRRFAEHPITQLLIDYKITGLFGLPRPVRVDPAALDIEGLQVDQLIGTSQNSWAERDYRSQNPIQFDAQRDLPGPVSIATASSRRGGSELGITIPGGRLVVFGNADFIANNRFRAFGNQTIFINSVNWSLNRTSMLNIPTRPLESYQLVMSERELKQMAVYFLLLPGIAAALGLMIHLLRRR
ncbi:GldG family protein [Coraliomargarita akajimensis]|nr:GldG family protein [Coraliomargarita akajimensis]